jgi:HEAT repeat protein
MSDKEDIGLLLHDLSEGADTWMREYAARHLGATGDARAIEPLRTALEDEDESVRLAAARSLKELGGWYPDEEKRAEIVKRDWMPGFILGFPEAIAPTLASLFEKPSEYPYLERTGDYLRSMIPHSSLTLEIVDLALMASSYESSEKGFRFWDRSYSVEKSSAAVRELCRIVSPMTSNILHLVSEKKTRYIKMSDNDDRSWEDTVYFQSQRESAESELQRRGNPRYDPIAYLQH